MAYITYVLEKGKYHEWRLWVDNENGRSVGFFVISKFFGGTGNVLVLNPHDDRLLLLF